MPNTSEKNPKMPTENTIEDTNRTANSSKENSNIKSSNDEASVHAKIADDLPVLAKDSYYLNRLERELARAVVTSKKSNGDTSKQKNNKADDALAKKRAQYDKIKIRSQEAVQARIDSIPSN